MLEESLEKLNKMGNEIISRMDNDIVLCSHNYGGLIAPVGETNSYNIKTIGHKFISIKDVTVSKDNVIRHDDVTISHVRAIEKSYIHDGFKIDVKSIVVYETDEGYRLFEGRHRYTGLDTQNTSNKVPMLIINIDNASVEECNELAFMLNNVKGVDTLPMTYMETYYMMLKKYEKSYSPSRQIIRNRINKLNSTIDEDDTNKMITEILEATEEEREKSNFEDYTTMRIHNFFDDTNLYNLVSDKVNLKNYKRDEIVFLISPLDKTKKSTYRSQHSETLLEYDDIKDRFDKIYIVISYVPDSTLVTCSKGTVNMENDFVTKGLDLMNSVIEDSIKVSRNIFNIDEDENPTTNIYGGFVINHDKLSNEDEPLILNDLSMNRYTKVEKGKTIKEIDNWS